MSSNSGPLSTSDTGVVPAFLSRSTSSELWHRRLRHHSTPLFVSLIKQFSLPVDKVVSFDCNSCRMAKSHKLKFPISETHTTAPFQLVHMDVWGPSPVASNKGFKYYLLVLDDFSRYSRLSSMHYKSEVKLKISEFKAYVQNQFGTSIKIVRSDNGGEFINHFLLHLFLSTAVIHQTTCPHTPEQNGVVKRKHRHLIETTITLLLQVRLPVTFWLEALITAVYLANRLPYSSLHYQVPYVHLYNTTPNYYNLKPFGCCCYPWLKPYTSHKLLPQSTPCVFLGYCDNTKGFRCYDPQTTKVYTSRHVQFLEHIFPYPSLVSSKFVSSSVDSSFYCSFNLM